MHAFNRGAAATKDAVGKLTINNSSLLKETNTYKDHAVTLEGKLSQSHHVLNSDFGKRYLIEDGLAFDFFASDYAE